MTLQNRVTPLGELISHPGRGLVFGNRGCLHDGQGRIRRHHAGKRWIACRLEFNGRRRIVMRPRHYTELFFLDEATAFAAGHRPCFECRRADYGRFVDLWREVLGHDRTTADDIDDELHAERIGSARRKRLHDPIALDQMPDGAFVLLHGEPHLVMGDQLLRWTMAGYVSAEPRMHAAAAPLITPPSLVGILRSGWIPQVPMFHPTARALTLV